jgi:hypothetical protein
LQLRQAKTGIFTGPKPLTGAEKRNRFCVGFRLAADPCKGILQARLTPHYREKNRAVVRRNGTEIGRWGRFFWSERGFTGLWLGIAGADFFSLILARWFFCSKNSQKTGFSLHVVF